MNKQIKLKIVTPEKLILEEEVDAVIVPTLEGEITILPEHIPIVAGLKSGDIIGIKDGPADHTSQGDAGREHIPMAVVGGFIEVKKDENNNTTVVILADFAEHVADITEDAIAKSKARAEELKKLAEDKGVVDFEHFAAELEKSLTRIKIADKWRSKKYRK